MTREELSDALRAISAMLRDRQVRHQLAALLDEVARDLRRPVTMPKNRPATRETLRVKCPECGAGPGDVCVSPRNKPIGGRSHIARTRESVRQDLGGT